MNQNQEKRLYPRNGGKLLTRIEDLKFGLIKAVMFNYSKTGSYIETNFLIQVGKEICIGIKSSPYKSWPGKYECYQARIIHKQKPFHSAFKYGYGIQYVSEHDDLNERHQQLKTRRNLRKYPRKPYCLPILFISDKQLVEGSIKDICSNGAFIETRKPFSAGELVTLDIPNKKNQNSKIMGKVVRHNHKGIGVQFLNVGKNN